MLQSRGLHAAAQNKPSRKQIRTNPHCMHAQDNPATREARLRQADAQAHDGGAAGRVVGDGEQRAPRDDAPQAFRRRLRQLGAQLPALARQRRPVRRAQGGGRVLLRRCQHHLRAAPRLTIVWALSAEH